MRLLPTLLAAILTFNSFGNGSDIDKTVLNMSYLNLRNIEIDSAQASVLTEINLSGNDIVRIPKSLVYAKDLKIVKLNSCRYLNIENLIKVLGSLDIEHLELGYCNLTYIPLEIIQLKHLKYLDLGGNYLEVLPANFYFNKNLEWLNLSGNNIEEADKSISNLEQLNYLDVSANPFINNQIFWKGIKNLDQLKELKANGCKSLPNTIAWPQNLEKLSLNDCESAIPINSEGGQKLEYLSLQQYSGTNKKEDDLLIAFKNATNLKTVILSGAGIQSLNGLIGFKNLNELDITTASIENTGDLSSLENLEKVTINSSDTNTIDKLLKSFNKLSVQNLEIKGNPYKVVPREISAFPNLKRLNLHGSAAHGITALISGMGNLVEIDLRGCKDIDTTALVLLKKKRPGTVIYFEMPENTYTNQKNSLITKPFPSIELPNQNFTVSTEGGTFIAKDGAKITIPANSLVDSKGRPVKEPVNLTYTTYRTPEEIFASGIPMTADSAGETKNFASAGMFTLQAKTAKGQTVYLKKGQTMKMDFPSADPRNSYNYYYLDTVKQNWIQTGTDNVVPDKRIKPVPAPPNYEKPFDPRKVEYSTIKIKTYDVKGRKEKPKFHISYELNNKTHHPDTVLYDPQEIKYLDDFQWEYAGDNNQEFFDLINKRKFLTEQKPSRRIRSNRIIYYLSESIEGVEIAVIPDKKDDYYLITLYINGDSIFIPAIPVLHEKNPSKIQKTNKEMWEGYVSKHKENAGSWDILMNKYKTEYWTYANAMNRYRLLLSFYSDKNVSYDQYMDVLDPTRLIIDSVNKRPADYYNFTRSLSLTGFGTYNCDYFYGIEDAIANDPQLIDEATGRTFNPSKVTLIDLASNAFISDIKSIKKLAKNRTYWVFATNSRNDIMFAKFATSNEKINTIKVKKIEANSIQELRNQLMY